MAIHYRSKTEIEGIRRAGQVVMEILEVLQAAVHPGMTTGELDAIAVRELARRGATSNFKDYTPGGKTPPFPGVICSSVNEEVVHGVPGKRALNEGDIIAIDFGAIVDGWHGDSAITVPVGRISPVAQRLLDVTREALARGIAAARPGARVYDITRAIQGYVEGEGFSLVQHYGGHGIGREMHEDPFIPNAMEPGLPNPLLRPGMVVCIEPMVSVGSPRTHTLPDKWTVITVDHSISAHFEHTLAITSDAPDVLTALSPARVTG